MILLDDLFAILRSSCLKIKAIKAIGLRSGVKDTNGRINCIQYGNICFALSSTALNRFSKIEPVLHVTACVCVCFLELAGCVRLIGFSWCK